MCLAYVTYWLLWSMLIVENANYSEYEQFVKKRLTLFLHVKIIFSKNINLCNAYKVNQAIVYFAYA